MTPCSAMTGNQPYAFSKKAPGRNASTSATSVSVCRRCSWACRGVRNPVPRPRSAPTALSATTRGTPAARTAVTTASPSRSMCAHTSGTSGANGSSTYAASAPRSASASAEASPASTGNGSAPASRSGASRSADRPSTLTRSPASSRRRAVAPPVCPVAPMTVIICVCLSESVVALRPLCGCITVRTMPTRR